MQIITYREPDNMQANHQAAGSIIQRAWANGEVEPLCSNLATQNLAWYEDVMDPPLASVAAVRAEWEQALASQTAVEVTIELLDWVETRGYHRCHATWIDDKQVQHTVDAIYVITLNDAGKIQTFLPWYTSRLG